MKRGNGAGLAPDVRQLRAQIKALESDLARERDTERNLRRRLEQFLGAAEATPDAVVVADAEGKIQFWNHAAEGLLGYRKEEALHAPVTIITPPSLRDRISERFERLRSGKPIDVTDKPMETIVLRKDGVEVPVEAIVLQSADERGPVLAEVLRDASQHHATEAALTRVNRAMERSLALSQALAAAEDERDFLDAVCRFLVAEGCHAAWIGRVERHKDTDLDTDLRIVRVAGHGPGDTKDILATTEDIPRGSATHAAVRTGKPILVGDVASQTINAAFREAAKQGGIGSILSMPLINEGVVSGCLVIYGRKPHAFSDQDAKLFEGFAMTLAAATNTLRQRAAQRQAEETLRFHNRALEAVSAVDTATAESFDLAQVLELGLDAILKALDAEMGAMYLLDPDGQTITMAAHQGVGPEQLSQSRQLRVDKGISGQAMKEKLAVVLDAADYPSGHLWEGVQKWGYKTLVSAPLLASGQVLGALTLATKRRHAFPETRRELLTSIGIQLGGAVHRARLHQEAQQRLKELTALNTLFQQQIAASARVKENQRRFVDGLETLAKETASFALEAQGWSPMDAHLQLTQRLAAFTKTLQGLSEELRHAAQADELQG